MATKKLPKFRSREAEARFWDSHSLADYIGQMKDVTELFTFAPELVHQIQERSKKKMISLRLAGWEIERSREGHYAYIIFSGPSQSPGVLDRHYQVSDAILRGLTVKIDPRHLDKIKPSLKALSEEGTAAAAAPAAEGAVAAPVAQETSPQTPA